MKGTAMTEQVALATAPATVVSLPSKEARGGNSSVSPFSNNAAFDAAQRMASALASSSLVPQAYQKNPSNCLIAMELASRIGVSVLAAMQSVDVIHGRPSWRSQFLIATVNASGRFTPLRFEWTGEAGKPTWACRAAAKDVASGETLIGPWISWKMAMEEGWVNKNGSKWKTMPELMFCYRAGAFWSRLFCPEIGLGFQTVEEAYDVGGASGVSVGASLPEALTPAGSKALEAVLGIQSEAQSVADEAKREVGAQAAESKPSGLLFSRVRPDLAGKPIEGESVQVRAAYIEDLKQRAEDLQSNQPKDWQRQLNALNAHLTAVEQLHEQLRADEEAPVNAS